MEERRVFESCLRSERLNGMTRFCDIRDESYVFFVAPEGDLICVDVGVRVF